MAQNVETGRTWQCGPASEEILGGIVSNNSNSVLDRQAAHIAVRHAVSAALARTIASHAFGNPHGRATR